MAEAGASRYPYYRASLESARMVEAHVIRELRRISGRVAELSDAANVPRGVCPYCGGVMLDVRPVLEVGEALHVLAGVWIALSAALERRRPDDPPLPTSWECQTCGGFLTDPPNSACTRWRRGDAVQAGSFPEQAFRRMPYLREVAFSTAHLGDGWLLQFERPDSDDGTWFYLAAGQRDARGEPVPGV